MTLFSVDFGFEKVPGGATVMGLEDLGVNWRAWDFFGGWKRVEVEGGAPSTCEEHPRQRARHCEK